MSCMASGGRPPTTWKYRDCHTRLLINAIRFAKVLSLVQSLTLDIIAVPGPEGKHAFMKLKTNETKNKNAKQLIILINRLNSPSKICMHATCMLHACYVHVAGMQHACNNLCMHASTHAQQFACMPCMHAQFACMHQDLHACTIICMHARRFACTHR